jgi:transposase InsO family protein
LPLLGVRQKNGSPGHPQTQGKIERFHQTLKRRLTAQPPPASPPSCNSNSTTFDSTTTSSDRIARLPATPPARPIAQPPKAQPATGHNPGHYRLRYDRLDPQGRMTMRRAGRMHHLGAGASHARKRVLALTDDHQVIVTDLTTGEVLSTHLIQPDKNYWRNQDKEPGRWPSS